MQPDQTALDYIDGNAQQFCELAMDIWNHPELGLEETYCAGRLASALAKAGFTIAENIGGMPTAFTATWGSGEPVIGVLGEYDALPGLSQKAIARKEPVVAGAPGHGCGHNQLGVASLAAALSAQAAMEQAGIEGTIVYYGCPAEETLIGKIFMARAGAFDGLDAALTWHPAGVNTVWRSSSAAMNSFKFNFYGKTAHAGTAPEAGRSALDGVMLTDVGINYLREHVPASVRIHCVVTQGGEAPNIVPDFAQVWYYVRAPRRDLVEEVYARVLDVAKGAALMSGTRVATKFITGCYNTLPNDVLGDVMLAKMKQIGAPRFSKDEIAFAGQIVDTLDPSIVSSELLAMGLSKAEAGFPICDKVLDEVGGFRKNETEGGSTDVADVSYCTPTAQFCTACSSTVTPAHSWQMTAVQGTSIGLKGMIFAAKTLSLSLLAYFQKPEILTAAREEFTAATGGKKYVSPLPDGLAPPLKDS